MNPVKSIKTAKEVLQKYNYTSFEESSDMDQPDCNVVSFAHRIIFASFPSFFNYLKVFKIFESPSPKKVKYSCN